MTLQLEIKVENQAEISRALKSRKLVKEPLLRFLRQAGFLVEAAAKKRATVDTGRMRASITSNVDPRALTTTIAPTVDYAAHVEFGTAPHFPPPSALQPWARRHGFPSGMAGAMLVARAIARRGTKARPFMAPALEASTGPINKLLNAMALKIEQVWGRVGR